MVAVGIGAGAGVHCLLVLVEQAGVHDVRGGGRDGVRPRVLVLGVLAGVHGGGRGARPRVLALVMRWRV